ncbi:MAG: hypothetical protein V1853_01585 [bacterium]
MRIHSIDEAGHHRNRIGSIGVNLLKWHIRKGHDVWLIFQGEGCGTDEAGFSADEHRLVEQKLAEYEWTWIWRVPVPVSMSVSLSPKNEAAMAT